MDTPCESPVQLPGFPVMPCGWDEGMPACPFINQHPDCPHAEVRS